MNRQDFVEWREVRAKSMHAIGGAIWSEGADAAYTILSKEISAQNVELETRQAAINSAAKIMDIQKQEIERLKEFIKAQKQLMGVMDKPSKYINMERYDEFQKRRKLIDQLKITINYDKE